MGARFRYDRKIGISCTVITLATLGIGSLALAAGSDIASGPPALAPVPTTVPFVPPPATQPQPVTAVAPATQPQPATAVAPAAPARKKFIGEVTATDVNVRSGPGTAYYPVGELTRGDLVRVVASIKSQQGNWYRIEAPAGTRCYIARQYVQVGANGNSGTVKGNFINLRAASAITPHSRYAVIGRVRQGVRVSITGQAGKYFIIRPPTGAALYLAGQFVRPAAAGSIYVTPHLRMPPGYTGSGLPTLSGPARGGYGSPAASTARATEPGGSAARQSGLASASSKVSNVAPKGAVLPPPSEQTIYAQLKRLNHQTVLEFHKPLPQETQLAALLKQYQGWCARQHLPALLRGNVRTWCKVIKKRIALRQLALTTSKSESVSKLIRPWQKQWKQSQKALAKLMVRSPFLAKGVLRTSLATKNYALVDPRTGRVIAYLEPTNKIALSKLLGLYIGVKGIITGKTGLTVRIIQAASATLLPTPKIRRATSGTPSDTTTPAAG